MNWKSTESRENLTMDWASFSLYGEITRRKSTELCESERLAHVIFLIWSQSYVIGQARNHVLMRGIHLLVCLTDISPSSVHSRHSQTGVWSEHLKNNGASTTRITHQIHVTRPNFRGEIHLRDRLLSPATPDFHQK